jgi:DNA-binding response OmpR family regulator
MKKILLIEDNQDVRENTAEILELANYNVVTAENGKVGVELAQKENPDLIICDIMMPVLDGYGVLHLLSKNPELSAIPLIFLSAKSERADVRRGMDMGADDYITKPFEESELLNAVESRLRKSEFLRKEISSSSEGMRELLSLAKSFEELKSLPDNYDTSHFKKKENVYREGQRVNFLLLVVEGKVKTFKTSEDGKELITGIYTKGDFIGYSYILGDMQTLQESCEALENAEVCFIPKNDFMQLVTANTSVAKKFIGMLAKNALEREEQLLKLAYNSLRKRIADGLLEVYSKFKVKQEDKPAIQFSREDLAQVVGTATESLIRTLSDFKHEKLIEIKEGKIAVLEEEKLRNLAN